MAFRGKGVSRRPPSRDSLHDGEKHRASPRRCQENADGRRGSPPPRAGGEAPGALFLTFGAARVLYAGVTRRTNPAAFFQGSLAMFKKIHHVGLITDDMERTVKMFREKLGCEPNRVQTADTGWAHATFLRMGDVGNRDHAALRPREPLYEDARAKRRPLPLARRALHAGHGRGGARISRRAA